LRTAYTGSAIRVRRSSDNTEQNIGFDVNGNLDTVALLAFCGVGNGFVTTWYDQSGNARNATQATAANQPTIVNSGVVLTDGNNLRPTVKFDGTNDELRSSYNLVTNLNGANFVSVNKILAIKEFGGIFGSSGGYGLFEFSNFFIIDGSGANNGNSANIGIIINNYNLLIGIYTQNSTLNSIIYNNNIQGIIATSNLILNTSQPLSIGGRTSNGSIPERVVNGNIQESILWYGTLTERTNIQNNINTYYAIY
jgi:hypothetical protein